MVRILCCSASVFSVATGAQICANIEEFDESVVLDDEESTTCGQMLSNVVDFLPSATTCQESITILQEFRDWDSDLENATIWENVSYIRLKLFHHLTSCCKDAKSSCHDYMPPICKNMDKFNSSATVPHSYFSYGTCGMDLLYDIDVDVDMLTFSPSATACRTEIEYAPDLQMVLGTMAVCCEDGETVCSDFNAQICKNKDQFDGFINSGVALTKRMEPEATCFHVSSAMDAFVPSKETCSEQITMPGFACCNGSATCARWDMCGGGNMSRMLVLEQLASCCNDGNTACDPYKAQICKEVGKFDPSVKFQFNASSSEKTACSLAVASIEAFVSSEASCAEEVDNPTAPGTITRKDLIDSMASNCCGTSESVCVGPWDVATTTEADESQAMTSAIFSSVLITVGLML